MKKRKRLELISSNEVTYALHLKKQIRRLKQLPDDFRDLDPGSRDWDDYATIMGMDKRTEMETWWRGSVLVLSPITTMEEQCLHKKEIIQSSGPKSINSVEDLMETLSVAASSNCSWIYLPDKDRGFVNALNLLLARLHRPVRIHGQLLSEFGGKPVGVVYSQLH